MVAAHKGRAARGQSSGDRRGAQRPFLPQDKEPKPLVPPSEYVLQARLSIFNMEVCVFSFLLLFSAGLRRTHIYFSRGLRKARKRGTPTCLKTLTTATLLLAELSHTPCYSLGHRERVDVYRGGGEKEN